MESPRLILPTFPAAQFDVRTFGAKGNGRANDTPAINAAIEKCSASGGGDVVFPPGNYAAASIHLQSNVRFVLDDRAVIAGARKGYDPPEPNLYDRYQDFGHSHFHNALMWGKNLRNFAIIGGNINGGHLVEGDPKRGGPGDKIIALVSSSSIHFQNVTHEEGAHFVYLLNDCESVLIEGITIKQSRDGVNLIGCRDVEMRDCRFTGCGDDTISIKSDYALGRIIAAENIFVHDCHFESSANAIQIGSETLGNFRNIRFSKITVGRAVKAAIGIRCADGGTLDGLEYSDITIKQARWPIWAVVTDRLRNPDPEAKVGRMKNIVFRNITATDALQLRDEIAPTSLIAGRADSPIENVVLENVTIESPGGGTREHAAIIPLFAKGKLRSSLSVLPAAGLFLQHASHVTLRDVTLRTIAEDARPLLVASDVRGFEIESLQTSASAGNSPARFTNVNDLAVRDSPGLESSP